MCLTSRISVRTTAPARFTAPQASHRSCLNLNKGDCID